MSLAEVTESKKAAIRGLAAHHGAGNIRLFRHVARGQETPTGDIDFLVDIVGKTSAWFPSGLALDLQDLLGRPVDVLTERSLYPTLRIQPSAKESRAKPGHCKVAVAGRSSFA